jgi:MFS family permease
VSTTTERPKVSLRQFWADLPTPGRWLLSTVAVQTLGRGLTLPFTVIYIHEVRGISLSTAGTLLALIAGVALAVTGPGGSLTDRLGARRMLIAGTLAQLVGCTVLAFAATDPVIIVGFVLLGFNIGV